MAGTLIGKAFDSREGEYSLEDKTATDVYKVQTSDPEDDHTVVAITPGLPRVGDTHPVDGDLICGSVLPRNDSGSRTFWLVTVVWVLPSAIGGEGFPQPQSLDPKQDIPTASWSTDTRQRIVRTANPIADNWSVGLTIDELPRARGTQLIRGGPTDPNTGNGTGDVVDYAMFNSAWELYDPPPTADDGRPILTIKMNVESAFAISPWLLTYKDAVNRYDFIVDGVEITSRQAKVQRVNLSSQKFRNGYPFRALEMVIAFDPETWDVPILDAGYQDAVGNKLRDVNGELPAKPVPLDGAGGKLENPTQSNSKYRLWNFYPEKDFNILPFIGLI